MSDEKDQNEQGLPAGEKLPEISDQDLEQVAGGFESITRQVKLTDSPVVRDPTPRTEPSERG